MLALNIARFMGSSGSYTPVSRSRATCAQPVSCAANASNTIARKLRAGKRPRPLHSLAGRQLLDNLIGIAHQAAAVDSSSTWQSPLQRLRWIRQRPHHMRATLRPIAYRFIAIPTGGEYFAWNMMGKGI